MTQYITIWEGRTYGIALMTVVTDAVTDNFRRKYRLPISEVINIFDNTKDSWIIKADEVKKGGKILINKIITTDFLEKNVREIYHYSQFLEKESETINNLTKKSNSELIQSYRVISSTLRKFYGPAFVPIFLEATDSLLSQQAEKVIRKKLASQGKENLFAEYFVTLLTPTSPSIMIKEELAFLTLLQNLDTNDPKQLKAHPLLRKHLEDWSWITYDFYLTTTTTELDYLNRAAHIDLSQIPSLIKERQQYFNEIKQKQEQCTNQLNLSQKELRIIHATRTYGEVKEYRKNILLHAWYKTHLLLKEIASRLSTEEKYLHFLHPKEIISCFETFPQHLAEQRMVYAVSLSKNGKTQIIAGEKARKLVQNLNLMREIDTSVRELKGTPAYMGKVTGRVRIINTVKEAASMQPGDILVSTATFPDLVPYMKIASAIITDEGGMTCHAAIVSRELRKPCIVGTKIATKVLKENELIEVDASAGIIRRQQ